MPSPRPSSSQGPGRDGSPSRPPLSSGAHLPNPDGRLGEASLPIRKVLDHRIPAWAPRDTVFFITVNALPRGQNHLAQPVVAAMLRDSFANCMRRQIWWPHLVLLMPDHLHALLTFGSDHAMDKAIADWKRYTARAAAIPWQRGFFDHRIRNAAALAETWSYILHNPVRRALAPTPDAWPYVWTAQDLAADQR